MRTKRLVMTIMVSLFMAGMLSTTAMVEAKVWKLKVQAYTAKSVDPQFASPVKLADFIREYTNGQVDITVFPVMKLVPPREIYSSVGRGVVDGGIMLDAYIAGAHPETSWGINPAIASSSGEYYACMWAGVRDILDREIMKDNVKMATFWDLSDVLVHGHRSKQLKTLEDFKGQKIRGFGGISSEFLKATGAGIIIMPMAEVYNAMQTGVMDGMSTGLPGYMSMKGYEVSPYVTWAKGASGCFTMMLILNLDIWKKFPVDIKKAIRKAERVHQFWHIDHMQKYMMESITFFKEKGAKVYVLPPDEGARWGELFKKVGTPWWLEKTGKKLSTEILQIVEKTLGKKLIE
jgi:TRAP-type C4-dicarboxylate transport system substrate-binding protein